MKTNRINTLARLSGLTIALSLFAGAAILNAEEVQTGRGGATKLLGLSGRLVTPTAEVTSPTAMACAKCKDEYVTRTDWTARGVNKPTLTATRHLCESCGNDWVVSGHGKGKTTTAVHKCTSCGAESMTCCSTSKSGVAATPGMEKKFEVAPVK